MGSNSRKNKRPAKPPPESDRRVADPSGNSKPLFAFQGGAAEDRRALYSDLSHLVRNPLNGLCGYIDYLFKGYAGRLTNEQLDPLGQAREAALRLQKSLDVLMDVAAFDWGLVSPEGEPVNLNDFLASIVRQIEEWVSGESLSISLKLPPKALWSASDEKWLKALLFEVITNAVRVSPKESVIDIRLWKEGAWALFRVQDQGPGVPEAKRSWIFQPLAQLKRRDDPPKGERGGLGLALAARVAAHYGGRIWAEGGSEGGLSVVIRLPLIKGG